MGLSGKEKFSYGLGAVGKDMVYMLSASYILYYYQDILGVNAVAMGIILLVARVFDAFNDPFMGVIRSQDQDQMGEVPPLADDRHGDQCRCSVSDVLGTACTEWQWTGSLCCSHLYSLGRDLYHDGYSLLVHDTGIYSQRKRT